MRSAPTTSSDPAFGRVLVRAPNWVGDVVMATPALRALRRAHPRAEITLEGPGFVEPLVRGLTSIDRFLSDSGSPLVRTRALRARGFDLAVLLPDSARSAIAPFLARVPERIGYARDPLRRALLTSPIDPPSEHGSRLPVSMIERYLAITRALGCADAGPELELAVDLAASDRVEKRLPDSARERTFVVTPGANFGASKLWPPDAFARACDAIALEHDLVAVLAPGPGEEPIARQIEEQMSEPAVLLTDPVTNLAELVALIDRAELLLTNDTGPRHIAVARGTPVVVVMGPTDPRHTAHLLERQRVLREPVECSPCHLKICPIDHRCMTRISPDRVVAAAEELLA